jgi:hypothetical protein
VQWSHWQLSYGCRSWGRSTSLHEALPVKNGELIHRRFPIVSRATPVGRDVAQRQPHQLGRRIGAAIHLPQSRKRYAEGPLNFAGV